MKTPFLVLSAVGLALAAQASSAASTAETAYFSRVDGLAARAIATAGVHVGYGLKLGAVVTDDGRLTEIRVTDSSGSRAVDRRVADAFGRVRLAAPVKLVGQEVSFDVRPGQVAMARAD